MDFEKLSQLLAQMQSAMDEVKSLMPSDATSPASEEESIDEQTEGAEEEQADPESSKTADAGEKDLKKVAIMRMMAKDA